MFKIFLSYFNKKMKEIKCLAVSYVIISLGLIFTIIFFNVSKINKSSNNKLISGAIFNLKY